MASDEIKAAYDVGNIIISFGSEKASITWLDFFLLIFCPLGAMLGTSVASAIERKKLYKDIPERLYALMQELISRGEDINDSNQAEVHAEYTKYVEAQYRHSRMGNGIIAMGLGIVVSLYFFGAITQDLTSIARVVGLSILLGYQAPQLWGMQEKAVSKFAEKELKSIMSKVSKK